MQHEVITEAWKAHNKLLAKAKACYVKADKFFTEGASAKAKKLCAKARELFDEGIEIYSNAVVAKHGNDARWSWDVTDGTITTK